MSSAIWSWSVWSPESKEVITHTYLTLVLLPKFSYTLTTTSPLPSSANLIASIIAPSPSRPKNTPLMSL